ncbi:TPA: F-type conjugal transfer pilus assembly protein TraB [Citrobacter farmeri]|uniref:F-type conjugal transfer pilus assembly protein TraB n=1 Tax=Citrobacter TaxID=544 RepID=UPI000E127D8F|nr:MULTISPECIES: F-type conjugal transfer pilus assembly protein TraB [Citrobacter]EKQ0626983.1 F-type conjugal transfer pilus assembly protein TraB [Salmonella enterica]MEC3934087.1 F-type conjugal transfer pilus assembly protein TraB [Citrobacter farmeri]UBI23198.1 F-type conjugal transfer pilus assembly protein TraB [Citrobacter amalonaticus]STA62741.1 conjugal transfer pilus assembly protein TraB [Citrobacter amalonaticus]BCU51137.1 conjugal transfer protein TraB [Citrobacter amalonaticus]
MSLNENLKTRRNQLAILAGLLVGGGAVAGGVMWYGQHQEAKKHPVQKTAPNMAGVVTASFSEQVNDSALTQQQAKTSALEQQMSVLSQQVAQNKLTTEQKLADKDAQIARLTEQLAKAPGSSQTTSQQTPPAGANGTPLPGPVAAGQARPPEYTVTPTSVPAATGAVNMGQGAGFYPGGSGQRITGGLATTSFNYDSLKKKPTKLPWIPSGSFSDAIMIEGADANASVTGQQNTRPVTFRLQGSIQMPNNKEYSADGCFVVGEIWGDISSERGEVRTKSISCVLKNGKHIDMAFNGHVSYQGKGGIRGKPVMRNGKIIGYAGAAGLLSGFGEGIKSAATPAVGLGATADVGAGDVFKQGFGGGANKAADTLSQYWIKRAEQYHPVIDIGAGNLVTVVFQEGFRLETLEDAEEQKAKEAVQAAGNAAQNAVAPQPASQQTTSTSTVSVGNINPDDVLRQASQLRLGDTIN